MCIRDSSRPDRRTRIWEIWSEVSVKYYNVIGFLSDEELFQVWIICAEALERKGWDCDNAELSIRAFDANLKQNVDSDTVCEPSPFDEHPYYYEW